MQHSRFVAALALLVACTPQVRIGGPVTPPSPEAMFPDFLRQPAMSPAVTTGRAGWPIVTFDPGIFVDDDGYHLFYTTLFCRTESGYSYSWDPANPTRCDITRSFGSIGYAFSSDKGLSWRFRQTPVVVPSDSGFDSAKIETAFVFRLRDTLYMTYSADGTRGGRKFSSRYQIGLAALAVAGRSVRSAMLDESTQFQRRPEPLLSYDLRPGRFDNNVQEPSVVVRPEGIFLYYIALGLRLADEPVEALGQNITSVAMGRAVLDARFNVISRSPTHVLQGVNISEVRYFDNAYHVFATSLGGGEFHRGETLTYARSADGIHWSTPAPLLKGLVRGLDDWGMMAPTAAVEDDRVVLFYTAYSSEHHACFPVPPEGRFGRPVVDGTECLYPTVGRAVARLRR